MIYSYKNQEPKPLPFRIKLSNGRTRTDPNTFTAEEIADAGYVVASAKPSVTYPEYVIWTGVDWELRTHSLSEIKHKRKTEATALRYNYETNHNTYNTSRESQAMLNGAWTAVQIDPLLTIDFKNKDGSWSKLNKDQVESIASEVTTWVQQCFTNEQVLHSLIDGCDTVEEVLAVNLNTIWIVDTVDTNSDATV